MASADQASAADGVAAYAPGTEWLGVVTNDVVAILEPSTPPAFAAQLWRRMRSGAAIEELVSMVPLVHDPDLSFALVEFGERTAGARSASATVVVRGVVAVDLYTTQGVRRARAGETKPWLLAEYQHVEALAVGPVGDEPLTAPTAPAGGLVAHSGLFYARRLVWSPSDRMLVAVEPDPGTSTVAYERAPRHGAEPGGVDDETVGAPALQPTPAESAPPESAPPAEPPARYWVRLPGGSTEMLRQPLIVGRNPVDRHPGSGNAALRVVSSPGKAVSSTHVRIEQHGTSVTITDEHSTNGTTVAVPGQEPRRLRPGGSLAVTGHARIELGGDRIVEIVPPHV